jgi:NAD(P)-dependent dehydrogenase (short-subunit alcohol dehydrogenase family)
MTKGFGATSTTDDVLTGVDLSRKRVLVTGALAGPGLETARALAAHDAQVVGAARDLAKAERATNEVRTQAANGGGYRTSEATHYFEDSLIPSAAATSRACTSGTSNSGIEMP